MWRRNWKHLKKVSTATCYATPKDEFPVPEISSESIPKDFIWRPISYREDF